MCPLVPKDHIELYGALLHTCATVVCIKAKNAANFPSSCSFHPTSFLLPSRRFFCVTIGKMCERDTKEDDHETAWESKTSVNCVLGKTHVDACMRMCIRDGLKMDVSVRATGQNLVIRRAQEGSRALASALSVSWAIWWSTEVSSEGEPVRDREEGSSHRHAMESLRRMISAAVCERLEEIRERGDIRRPACFRNLVSPSPPPTCP